MSPLHVRYNSKETRAMALLRSFLDAEQQATLDLSGRITVTSEMGNRWQLILGSASIRLIEARGVPVPEHNQWFGIYARTRGLEEGYPSADGMLAMKLLLETDEQAVLRAACH